jgi:riboflavin synthase
MFTGIIESQAVLKKKNDRIDQVCFTFEILGKKIPFRLGESVAVDGVCLTVSAFNGKNFSADIIPETLNATTLSHLTIGDRVNIEPALRLGTRMGGHFLTGHVDGVGRIQKFERRGRNFRLQIKAPIDIMHHLVVKGSIAIDGISFTLQQIRKQSFTVGLTPHTFQRTALQRKQMGEPVNLEVDLLAKLVRNFLSRKQRPHLKVQRLRSLGF